MAAFHLAKYNKAVRIPHRVVGQMVTHIPLDLNFSVAYLDNDSSNVPKILSLVYNNRKFHLMTKKGIQEIGIPHTP